MTPLPPLLGKRSDNGVRKSASLGRTFGHDELSVDDQLLAHIFGATTSEFLDGLGQVIDRGVLAFKKLGLRKDDG